MSGKLFGVLPGQGKEWGFALDRHSGGAVSRGHGESTSTSARE